MTLLPQTTLDQLSQSRLTVRRAMNGTRNGNHRSPFTGASADFAQHREYCQGDEPRRIDWRVLARTDRLVVKQYDQETNLRATLVLDASASMGYAGTGKHRISKWTHATRLSAALAWLLIGQGDSVGLVAFHQQICLRMPTSSTAEHLHHMLQAMEHWTPQLPSSTPTILHQLAETLPSRGLIILCSDLLDDPAPLQHALHHLRHRNHEVIVMHVLAPEEVSFPFTDSLQFLDMEGNCDPIDVDPNAIRREYLRQMQSHLDTLKAACHHVEADYLLTTSDQAVPDVLIRFLATRLGKAVILGGPT